MTLQQLQLDSSHHRAVPASEASGVLGTSFYISPEIANGWPQYDNKVDLYSLGVIAFELWYPFTTAMERVVVLRDLVEKGVMPPGWAEAQPVVWYYNLFGQFAFVQLTLCCKVCFIYMLMLACIAQSCSPEGMYAAWLGRSSPFGMLLQSVGLSCCEVGFCCVASSLQERGHFAGWAEACAVV